jgi:hypothetical protein
MVALALTTCHLFDALIGLGLLSSHFSPQEKIAKLTNGVEND